MRLLQVYSIGKGVLRFQRDTNEKITLIVSSRYVSQAVSPLSFLFLYILIVISCSLHLKNKNKSNITGMHLRGTGNVLSAKLFKGDNNVILTYDNEIYISLNKLLDSFNTLNLDDTVRFNPIVVFLKRQSTTGLLKRLTLSVSLPL